MMGDDSFLANIIPQDYFSDSHPMQIGMRHIPIFLMHNDKSIYAAAASRVTH